MRLSPIVGWIAVLAVACGGPGADTAATDPPEASTTIPPSSPTQAEDGFVPPASPTLDPGVATDVEVPATEAEVAAFGDRHNLPPTREGTVDLRLDRCRLVSPGRYAFDGHVTLDGVEQVRVGLSLTGWEGLPQIVPGNDVGQAAASPDTTPVDVVAAGEVMPASPIGLGELVAVTFTETGAWTLPWPPAPPDQPTTTDTRGLDACSIDVVWSGTTSTTDDRTVEVTVEPRELTWTAPAGSLQTLGIGATLGDTDDPRLLWAHLVHQQVALPLATVWAPPPASDVVLWDVGGHHRGGCAIVSMSGDGVSIGQGVGCTVDDLLPDARSTGQSTPDGDRWFTIDAGTVDVLVRELDDRLLTVGSERGRARILEVVDTLQRFDNHVVSSPPAPPGSPAARDVAIGEAVSHNDWVERGRLEFPDGSLLVVVEDLQHVTEQVHEESIVGALATRSGESWTVDEVFRVSWDGCLATRLLHVKDTPLLVAVAGLDDWHLRIDALDLDSVGTLLAVPDERLDRVPPVTVTRPNGTPAPCSL